MVAFRECEKHEQRAVEDLFISVFSQSKGEEEGALIGQLARELFDTPGELDLFPFVSEVDDQIVGAIFFSRMVFDNENAVVLLAPVAVHSAYQGKGIGQALIRHGLSEMHQRGAKFAFTYGDPRFYEKVGFRAVSSEVVRPRRLSQPQGWLGQSLCDRPIESLQGESRCVPALNKQVYW